MTENKEKSFEESLERLAEIVKLLEDGKAPLDETMKYYEEGIGLVRVCTERLKNARQKVTELTGNEDD